MHQHPCKYCKEEFVCPEEILDCFVEEIVCDRCFWRFEFEHYVVFFLIAVSILLVVLNAVKNDGQ